MTNRWGLLTNHALVLVHVVEHPRSTLREIADSVGITDRAALSILRALEEDAIVARRKEGRRNVYSVDLEALLAHRQYGKYSIAEIASALLRLSGQAPDLPIPPAMQLVGDTRPTVMERLPSERDNGAS
jgi:DNA-binding transcriptional ArsR family regulator